MGWGEGHKAIEMRLGKARCNPAEGLGQHLQVSLGLTELGLLVGDAWTAWPGKVGGSGCGTRLIHPFFGASQDRPER